MNRYSARLAAALVLWSLAFSLMAPSPAKAEGLFARWRPQPAISASQRTSRNALPAYSTRNLQPARTRLPAGRSYYQGRYYGNLNNRFYGPQYGYF